jgi:thiamine transporter
MRNFCCIILKFKEETAVKTKITTRQLVESGVLLALGYVLSIIKIKLVAVGGSITLVSMLPIIVLAYKYGAPWGALCGFIHGLLQILEGGGFAPPTKDFISYVLVFLLDYAFAWAFVGLLAGLLRNISTRPQFAIAAGSFVGIAGRFLCSFLSGVIIWRIYAPEGQSVILYSLGVNASVMVPEMLATTIIGFVLFSVRVLQDQVRPTQRSRVSA